MSTKSSLLLSDANEHWYQDTQDETFNLEIGKEHKVTIDEDGLFVEIKEDSPLGKAIRQMLNQYYQHGFNMGQKSKL